MSGRGKLVSSSLPLPYPITHSTHLRALSQVTFIYLCFIWYIESVDFLMHVASHLIGESEEGPSAFNVDIIPSHDGAVPLRETIEKEAAAGRTGRDGSRSPSLGTQVYASFPPPPPTEFQRKLTKEEGGGGGGGGHGEV